MLSILLLPLLGWIAPTCCLYVEDSTYDDSNCTLECFQQPPEFCPSDSRCRCTQIPNCRKAAICCNVNKFTLTEGLGCGNINADPTIEALYIWNATLEELNLSDLVRKNIKYLTVTDGRINKTVGRFPVGAALACLNLSSNGIKNFSEDSLSNLKHLNYIDLSKNKLTAVPKLKTHGNISLDISGNPYMNCSSVEETLNRENIFYQNENSTICSSSQSFHWFNTTDQVALSQLRLLHELEKNCIKNCTCQPYRFEYHKNNLSIFTAEVNCSGSGLSSLPPKLPPLTRALDVSNNNITNLKKLQDPSYQFLVILNADNNQISSIQPLEGTKFMSSFIRLSLRNNSIKTFETYLLSNMKFYRTEFARHMNLGLNKLHCDCQTAMEFKVWLLTKVEYVPDYQEILCENMRLRVTELDSSKLCQGQHDWTDYISYINYIIAAEVLLLIGLIAKVSYDYWVFKTAGYLPWPASKMPKLPCDWLCE